MPFAPEDYCDLVAVFTTLKRDPFNEAADQKLRVLQEKHGGHISQFHLLCLDIDYHQQKGLVYDRRRLAWITPAEKRRGGRPRREHLDAAWKLARVELRTQLRREKPTQREIAEHLLKSDSLRVIGQIRGIVDTKSLLRVHRRCRTNPLGYFCPLFR